MNKTVGPVTTGAAAGGGVGGAFAIVLVWVLAQFGIDMPIEVAMGVGLLVTTLGTLVGGYLVPSKSKGDHAA